GYNPGIADANPCFTTINNGCHLGQLGSNRSDSIPGRSKYGTGYQYDIDRDNPRIAHGVNQIVGVC
ncbi:MAG: hypothetical protein WCP36_10245, partial [Methanomicrobiales archaeon]